MPACLRNGSPARDRGEILDAMPAAALESERAILAAAILHGRIDPAALLPAEEFYDSRHQFLWRMLSTLEAEHGRFDDRMVLQTLVADPRWRQDGLDAAFLAELVQGNGTVHVAWHAEQVHAAYIRRSVGRRAESLLQKTHNACGLEELQSELQTLVDFVDRGRQDGQTSPDASFTRLYSGSELLALDLRPEFLIRDILVEGQPMIVGGRSKAMKTSVAVDLALSLGSGTPFLGRFASQRAAVGFWSGESGAATVRETARRIAASKGVELAAADCHWSFELPRLSEAAHLKALETVIQRHKLRVAMIDPLYLSLLTPEAAGGASNVFLMGSLLQGLTRLGQKTHCTIVLLHHFRKGGLIDQENPANLEELAQSGAAEWARQWLLLQRRTPYQGDGRHSLWLRSGGSAGHSSLWGLTIDEGTIDPQDFAGRRWEVIVNLAAEAREEARRDRENRKAAQQEQREGKHRDELLAALKAFPQGETASILRKEAGLNISTFRTAITLLLREGRAARCHVTKNTAIYEGFKPTEP